MFQARVINISHLFLAKTPWKAYILRDHWDTCILKWEFEEGYLTLLHMMPSDILFPIHFDLILSILQVFIKFIFLPPELRPRVWNSLLQDWCQILALVLLLRLLLLLLSAEAHSASFIYHTESFFSYPYDSLTTSQWTDYDYLSYCIEQCESPNRCGIGLNWKMYSTALCVTPHHLNTQPLHTFREQS